MPKIFFFVVIACGAVALIQQYFEHSRSSQRRIYWGSSCVGFVAAFLAFYPDSRKGFGMALFFLSVMIAAAYSYTPYIKIRGKVYALSVQDSQPDPDARAEEDPATADPDYDPAPDAYSGLLTARKAWWILVIVLGMSSGNIYAFAISDGDRSAAAIGVGFILFLSIVGGLGDASWDYPVARGQRIQFGIIAVITLGTFTVLYLLAYCGGKRWPVRREGSMEYRTHPRHRRLD